MKLTEGYQVRWASAFGVHYGKIEKLYSKGCSIASTSGGAAFSIKSEEPTALVAIYAREGAEWKPTGDKLPVKLSLLKQTEFGDSRECDVPKHVKKSVADTLTAGTELGTVAAFCAGRLSGVDRLTENQVGEFISQYATFSDVEKKALGGEQTESYFKGWLDSKDRRDSEAEINLIAAFGLEKATGGNGTTVYYEGKCFELGDYPDKKFGLNDAEADRAIANFAPVDNDLEHMPTVLDGKLGRTEKVWRKGKEIFQRVGVPDWLAKEVGNNLKVSLAFDRGTKHIIGNALVLRPRITDATVVQAAFASHPATGKESGMKVSFKTAMAALAKAFSGGEVDPDAEIDFSEGATTGAPSKREKELEAEVQKLKDSEAAFAKSQKEADDKSLGVAALAFADSVIKEQKELPSEREFLADQFSNAVRKDAGDKALFADGKPVEGDALKRLKKHYADKKAFGFTAEQLKEAGITQASFSDKGTVDPERVNELLGKTTMGRAVLAERNGKK